MVMKFGFDHGGKKSDDRVTEQASNWVVEWQSESQASDSGL
jgi:hypothetical protein